MNIMFFLTPKSETIYEQLHSSMRQAAERMDYHHLSAIPIIDDLGVYIGTLTEGDLLEIKGYADLNLRILPKSALRTSPEK